MHTGRSHDRSGQIAKKRISEMRLSTLTRVPHCSRAHAHAARTVHHNAQSPVHPVTRRRRARKSHRYNRPYSTQASYPPSSIKRSLPVIDWCDDSGRAALPQACRRDGFVYLKSAMPLAMVKECLHLSQWFFGLESSMKLRCQGD